MSGNSSLNKAKDAKQDEFYTRLTDIEKELRHYRKHFKGAVVLCNCDDPYESNFFKYFALNFNKLKLSKLIATSYAGSPITGTHLAPFGDKTEDERRMPYKAIVTSVRDTTGDGGVDMLDVAELFRSGENTIERLDGDGDFRSPECLKLLDEADIVVTNPPFSLFREYVTTLLEYRKRFVIVGNMNALKYKEMFPHLKNNKIWLGYKPLNQDMYFDVPEERRKWLVENKKEGSAYKVVDGVVMGRLASACWFTNLDIKKRHEDLILVKRYTPEEYPSYTNYDGIDVSSVANIPYDYAGNMGVPITVMEHFNPDQFELIGTSTGELGRSIGVTPNYRGRTDVAYVDNNGNPHCPYQRFIIRNRHPEPPKET